MNKKISLKISGMDCASCAANIERTLKKEAGIISVNVNFSSAKAFIEYEPKKINQEKIGLIIRKIGYKVVDEKKDIQNEIKKGWLRFWFGLVLTLPVWIIATFFYNAKWNILLFVLASLVQIVLGYPFYKGAYYALKQRTADMNVLVSLSASAAYFYSLFATFFISGPVFYEASTTVLTTITLGMLLEKSSQGKVGESIKKLMKLEAKNARVQRDGQEIEIPISQVKKDDVVIVRPGEKIASDGIIIEGKSSIDESMITGESMPKDKGVGDEIIGGTINKTGAFKLRITKVGEETALAQIIKLVEEAQASKAPIQRIADKVVAYFVPIVLAIALISFVVWYFVIGNPFLFALTALVSVLVIACPCALGIATPTAIMAGTSKGAENGILIKGGQYLEKARELNTLIFDKTGTITKGKPEVTDILEIQSSKLGLSLLQIAASIEQNSEHPLAQAIINEAKKQKIETLKVQDFKALSGKGVQAELQGQNILLGTKKLMIDNKINTDLIEENIKKLENQGKTTTIIAINNEIVGLISVSDTLKEHSKEAVQNLKEMDLEIIIISGDNERTVKAVGKQLGINKVLAEVLPEDKEKEIKKLQKEGKVVGAVGDGINDAPMLAQADIGIAMGAGTDIAKETGGIIFLKNDIRDVEKAIKLSRLTFSKIRQNIFLAFIYNILAIPLAAGLFYHWLGFLLHPEIAALAMILSDISVVGNSLLLRRHRLK